MKTDSLPKSVTSLFTSQQRWQSWLDVESALALSQAEVGMIPQSAAQEIALKSNLKYFDIEALERDITQTMAPVLSVTHALANLCESGAGAYVHWGATTQNVMLAGRVLQMRKAHNLMLARLGSCFNYLAILAHDNAQVVMTGRTNRKHALPITFGFKVASWIDELHRCIARFEQNESRVFTLVFGGAIGAMHSFGDRSQAMLTVLAQRLNLSLPLVHSRATLDGFIEYILSLSMLAMCCSRVGQELYQLMSEEFGEVREALPSSVRGSSTMPHKDNPKHVVTLIAKASRLRALAAPALEAGQPSHEGDAASNQLLYGLIDEACPLAYEMIVKLENLLQVIEVNPTRMQQNLARTADVLASENLMMLLAEKIGRQEAHDVVHESIHHSKEQGKNLVQTLCDIPQIAESFSAAELTAALDPNRYIGNSTQIAQSAAVMAQTYATKLASHL